MKSLLSGIFLILLFIIPINAQSYKLEYKFEKGKSYIYRDSTFNTVVQEMMGQEMKITSDVVSKIRLTAEDAKDGLYTIVVSLDSILIHTSIPKDTTYSLDQIINKRVRLNVNGTGKVQSREVIDSLDLNELSMGVGNREMLQLVRMPEKEVAAGETWTSVEKDTMDAMGGNLTVTKEFTFNLAGEENISGYDCVKIPFTSKTTIEGTGNMQGFEFFMEGSGNSTGTIYIEPDLGLMISYQENVDNNITMAATGQQNLVIPITQSSKVVRSLVK